jgi:indole-3-glycerol phosphate synthase
VSLLEDILATKRVEVEALRGRPRLVATREPLNVVETLRREDGGTLRLIAEVKLRSPSAGVLSRGLTPDERALAYAEAGASMVSVLCDTKYFDGSWEHLSASRGRLDADRDGRGRVVPLVPLLAKDFVVDERQIGEARDRGADAVLLIARIVDRARLVELVHAARDERIEPVVEVVDERELESALEARARVVGVNARDLDTLEMDAERAARVLAAIPRRVVAVHLSGLRSASDVAVMAGKRADAALIGEALMREDDPRALLGTMVRAAARPLR